YDYLILATGVAAAYHGVPGAAEYTLGLYTRHDAIVLRDRIMIGLEHISVAGLRGDVTVTVIGGGATGVELAGSLADLRNIALAASFPEIDRERVHVALIEQAPALLGPFHPALRDYTRRQLTARGVDVRLGTAIAETPPRQVVRADGSALPSDVTVWAAGVAAPEAAAGWGLPQGRRGGDGRRPPLGGRGAAPPAAPRGGVQGPPGFSRSGTSRPWGSSPCRGRPSRPCRWASTPPAR